MNELVLATWSVALSRSRHPSENRTPVEILSDDLLDAIDADDETNVERLRAARDFELLNREAEITHHQYRARGTRGIDL